MWVDSKTAAAVLGVSNKAIQKACLRATKANKKICKIKSHICNFIYADGIGRGGKILQIWLDEQSQKLIDKGESNENIKHTRTSRAFAKQGLCCDPVSAQWQGEYKSSKDRQEDTTKETSPQPKSSEGSVNDEKYNKTSYETQEERLDKSSQNSTITDIRALKVHKEKETINDEKNKANLEEIRNPHISSGKRDNADNSVDEFQSYAIEQKNSLAELFDDMNINDDKKADAFLKAKVVKLWLKARDRKVKIDAFLQYININNMYGKRVSKGQIYDWARRYANGGIKGLVDERGGNRPLLV
ncbi:helix-turn-helix domain-containing protein, partial [Campylobacter fetus]